MKICQLIILIAISISIANINAYPKSSKWNENQGAKWRIIAQKHQSNIKAAMEIKLKKNWKTYWYAPGDSGIAPHLDFSQSVNVKNAKLKLPTPQTFINDNSVGYKDNVIFAIDAETIENTKQTILNVKGLMGICEKVCVPVIIDVSLDLSQEEKIGEKQINEHKIIANAFNKLPKKQNEKIKIIKTTVSEDSKFINVKTKVPENSKQTWLYVNAPPKLIAGNSRLVERNKNIAHFKFPVKEKIKKIGEKIQYVIVADDIAVEQSMIIGEN